MSSDKAKRGRRAREYGHDFERLIVRKIKERFAAQPWAGSVRRSDQSHRAHRPDVTGVYMLWPELQTAEEPDPAGKHAQAVRDVAALPIKAKRTIVPVAITRKKRSRSIQATLLLGDAVRMSHVVPAPSELASNVLHRLITMQLDDFFDLYAYWMGIE